jgi:integrase
MNSEDPEIVGNRVRIRRRGIKGTFCADFWNNGKHCRMSLKTKNRKIAVDRALDIAHSLKEGTYQQPKSEVPLKEAASRFLAFHKTEGRADSTITRYSGELQTFLEFCERRRIGRLSAVSPTELDLFRAERRKIRELPTVNHETAVIKGFSRWCRSRRLVAVDPLAEYHVAKAVPKKRPAPTLAEVQAVLAKSSLSLRRILATLAFSGLRIGELQHLRANDVDLAKNWIQVESRKGAETKTRRSRKIPIHPLLRELLLERGARRGPWFFCAAPSSKFPAGDHWISPKKINDAFQRIAEGLGLTVGRKSNGYTIHSLRHFFETFTVNSRVPQRVVDAWMGHQSDRSMGAVYYTLTEDDSQRFMKEVPFSLGSKAIEADRAAQS